MKKDPYREIVYLKINVLCDHPYVVSFTFCCSAIPTTLILLLLVYYSNVMCKQGYCMVVVFNFRIASIEVAICTITDISAIL